MFKMNFVVFSLMLLVAVVVSGGPAWKDTNVQRGSGLKIGVGGGRNISSTRGNGIKVGSGGRGPRTTTTTTPQPEDNIPTPSVTTSSGVKQLTIGLVVPYKSFGSREYTKAFTSTKSNLARKLVNLFKNYELYNHVVMKELTPSPTATPGDGSDLYITEIDRGKLF